MTATRVPTNWLMLVAKWQSANKDVKLSNYLDDIEREFDALEEQGARNLIVRC